MRPTMGLLRGLRASSLAVVGFNLALIAHLTVLAHASLTQGSILTGTTMIGAHLAATAVMVGLLAYGEQALWFLAGCVRTARWLRVAPPAPPPARIAVPGAPPTVCLQLTSGGVGRRGPPMSGLRTAV